MANSFEKRTSKIEIEKLKIQEGAAPQTRERKASQLIERGVHRFALDQE